MASHDKCHKSYWTARVATGLLLASAGTFVCHVYADATEQEQEKKQVATEQQKQDAPKSAVQRELDALYAEHGGIAPDMTKEAAAKAITSQQNPKNAVRPPVVLPTTTQVAAQKKPKRFFLFGARQKSKSNTATAQTAPTARRSSAPRPRQTAGPATVAQARSQAKKTKSPSKIQPAQFTADEAVPQAGVSENSPIMRELKKLYAKDGREFPKLPTVKLTRTKASPQTGAKQAPAAAKPATARKPVQTAGKPAQTVKSAKKPNLLQRLFRRSAKKTQVAQQSGPAKASKPQAITPAPEPELLPIAGVAEKEDAAADDLGSPFNNGPDAEIAQDEPDISQPVIRPIPVNDQPELAPAKPEVSPASKIEGKLRQIAERKGMSGFKGFCPVVLCDNRDLVDTVPEFSSTVELRVYYFSTSEAKAKFDANVEKYAPVAQGNDVVLQTTKNEDIEGSLEYAVWYRGRLYLFDTADTKSAFRKAPATYAISKPVE